ncbi:MAG: PQQ-binding-like beta-propeller repeat protein [Ktedonobacterales bacterium]
MRVLFPSVRICGRQGRLRIAAERISFSDASSWEHPHDGFSTQGIGPLGRITDVPAWEVPRASVSGVSATANLVSADLVLVTVEGKQYPVAGVLFRDALVAIELLGYVPAPGAVASGVLSIPTNYTPGRFEINDDVVRMEGRETWEVARADVRGVSIEVGALTVRLTVHLNDGRMLLANSLPFNGALRAVEWLGYVPRKPSAQPPAHPLGSSLPPPVHPSPATATSAVPPASLPVREAVPSPPASPVSPASPVFLATPHATTRETVAEPDAGDTVPEPPRTAPATVSRTSRLRIHALQGLGAFKMRLARQKQAGLRHAAGIASTWAHTRAEVVNRARHILSRRPRFDVRRVVIDAPHARIQAGARRVRTWNMPQRGVALLTGAWSRMVATLRSNGQKTRGGVFALLLIVLLCAGGLVFAGRQPPVASHHASAPRGPATAPALAPAATAAPPPAAPPIMKVFVGSHDGSLYALRASDGSLVWRYATGGQIESAPALAGGVVYIGSDDHTVYALHSQDNAIVWRYTTGGKVGGTPSVAGGAVYVGSDDGALYALRASDGALLWRYQTSNWVVGQPAVVNGVVYVGSYDDSLYALRARDGALLWRYQTGGAVVSSPAVAGDVVYVGSADNALYALRARDGALLWQSVTGGSLLSSPAVANGMISVGSCDDAVYTFRASDGALLWKYATGGLVLSSPVIAQNTIYIGSYDHYLYALRASDGVLLWRYQTGAAVNSVPQVLNGMVYVGSSDHDVYALRASDGALRWTFQTGNVISPRLAVGG